MPELINPLLSTSVDVSTPDISVELETTPWKRPEVTIPDVLKIHQSAFEGMPNQMHVNDFSKTVNEKLTPEEIKAKEADKALMSSLGNNVPLRPDEKNFRFFSSADAMRYKQNDRLWKEQGYNPDLPTDITDAIYDHHETTWESFKNIIPKMWSTTAFSFKNYFAEYVDTAKAIGRLDANVLHSAPRFDAYLREQKELEALNPDYKTDDDVRWYQLNRGDFWEESASSLGFTIGTIGASLTEGAAISAATAGFGAIPSMFNSARKVYKAISDYYSLKRAYGLVKGVLGAKTVLGKLGHGANIWRLTNGALSEAAFEAASNKHEYLESFRDSYLKEHGYAPSEREMSVAEKAADKMANATVLFQTPFLMASNAVQFGNMIAPKTMTSLMKRLRLDKAAYKFGMDDAFKVTVEATEQAANAGKVGMIKQAAKGALGTVKNSLWEGTEESYQALVSKSTQDYYNDQYFNKDNNSILKSIGTGYDYVTSNQGLKEFAAGFATGSIFKIVGTPMHWAAKPKKVIAEDGTVSYKENFANKYFNIGTERIRKDAEKTRMQDVAQKLNATSVENLFREEGFLSMVKDKSTALALAKFMETGDMFNMQNAQNLQLNRFLFAGLATGKIDLQIKKLQDFAAQDFGTLKDFFELNEEDYATTEDQDAFVNSFRGFVEGLSQKTKDFEKIFEAEKGGYNAIIGGAAQNLDRRTRIHNFYLSHLRNKYNVENDEDLESLVNEQEADAIKESAAEILQAQTDFYGANEAMKASVFSQVGMNDAAERGRAAVRELVKNNTVHAHYNELGDFFDPSYRVRRIAALKEDLRVANETRNDIDLIKEQVESFEALNQLLDEQFKEGKEYNEDDVTDAIQKYMYSIENRLNRLDNNTSLAERITRETPEQYERLKEFVKLQRLHQENLNLFNMLSSMSNRENYSRFQSKKIKDFLIEAAKLGREDMEQAAKEEEADKAKATAAATPPPPAEPETPPTAASVVVDPDAAKLASLKEELRNEISEAIVDSGAISTEQKQELVDKMSADDWLDEFIRNISAYVVVLEKKMHIITDLIRQINALAKAEIIPDIYVNPTGNDILEDEEELEEEEELSEEELLLAEALSLAPGITSPIIRDSFVTNVRQGLKELADQLHMEGTADAANARVIYGDRLSDIALTIFPKTIIEEEEEKEPEPEPEVRTVITPVSYEDLREMYAITEQAMEEGLTYEEMLKKLDIKKSMGKINDMVDTARREGEITGPTRSPNEILPDGTLDIPSKPYKQARYYFMQKISDGTYKPEDFKLVVSITIEDHTNSITGKVTKVRVPRGTVADKDGNILKFDKFGNISTSKDASVNVFLPIELISYNQASLNLPRIVASTDLKVDPKVKQENALVLNPSLVTAAEKGDVQQQILDYIENSKDVLTASIDHVTQGQLLRPGITNDFNSKTDLTGKRQTLSELLAAGDVHKNNKGLIPDVSDVHKNTVMRAGRINVNLKRNVNNEKDGYEVVEFIPKNIGDIGSEQLNVIKEILAKGVKGQLDTSYETFLKKILNRGQFLILNLGTNLLVVDKKKFRALFRDFDAAASADMLAEAITNLTSVDDILATKLNLDLELYNKTADYKLAALDYPADVSDIIENYVTFVQDNVTSSAKKAVFIKGSEGQLQVEGYGRVNKRLVVTLDKNMADMSNEMLKDRIQQENSNHPIVSGITDNNTDIFTVQRSEEEDSDEALLSYLSEIGKNINNCK